MKYLKIALLLMIQIETKSHAEQAKICKYGAEKMPNGDCYHLITSLPERTNLSEGKNSYDIEFLKKECAKLKKLAADKALAEASYYCVGGPVYAKITFWKHDFDEPQKLIKSETDCFYTDNKNMLSVAGVVLCRRGLNNYVEEGHKYDCTKTKVNKHLGFFWLPFKNLEQYANSIMPYTFDSATISGNCKSLEELLSSANALHSAIKEEIRLKENTEIQIKMRSSLRNSQIKSSSLVKLEEKKKQFEVNINNLEKEMNQIRDKFLIPKNCFITFKSNNTIKHKCQCSGNICSYDNSVRPLRPGHSESDLYIE